MSGTLVELLKLPLSRAGELKLCSVTGRQVSIRDLNTEKMSFVPLKEPIERITCMTSGWYVDKQLLAVGFTENEAEDVIGIEVFSTTDTDRMVSECDRMRFKIPKHEVITAV